ncbi:MAG: hypothetical protein ABGZ35_03315 [Planctomycetaceae bacterium]
MVALLMNAETQVHTQVFEQVYTSASALLDRAHGDLGIVCETVGFPREIQPDLDHLNSYQPIETLSGEFSEKHPPAYTIAARGPQGEFYVISRTVFAGADHTGRTNPLAHHMVVPTESAHSIAAPADLVHSLRTFFMSRWDDEPRRWEQPRDVAIVNRLGSGQDFPSPAWRQLTSAPHVAAILGFFAEHVTSNAVPSDVSVVFIIPPSLGDDACRLLTDLLAVLPASFASAVSARTHVVSPPGVAGQCRVMFTYPNTAFLAQARRRQDEHRPVIIDLVEGDPPDLPCTDYGAQIKRILIEGGTGKNVQTLVNLRSEMGVLKDSTGTPFSDFKKLQQKLQSPRPLQNIDTVVPLLRNVARASASAETMLSGLLEKAIVKHFKARKGDSDWPAFTSLAFSGGVPRKSQQLARKYIEQCPANALPHVFEHPRLADKSADKIRLWLRKCVDRPGVVSFMIQHAIQHPTARNVESIRKTLFELQPDVRSDECENWGRILQTLKGSAVQTIRKLIGELLSTRIRSGTIPPLTLMRAIPLIVDNCNESERHQILFELLEASADASQFREFVRWVVDKFGVENELVAGYDVSRHSDAVRAALKEITVGEVKLEAPLSVTSVEPRRKRKISEFPAGQRTRRSVSASGQQVEQLISGCKWLLGISTLLIILAVPVFMILSYAGLLPELRIPETWPHRLECAGLSAFPLSVLFFAVMRWRVRRNRDPARMTRSLLYLGAAAVAMLSGTACTLFACFHWLR